MISKSIFLVCLMVAFCGAQNYHFRNILDDICVGRDTQKCRELGQKCIVRDPQKVESNFEWRDRYCRTFETCLDSLPEARAIYRTFILMKMGGQDWCSLGRPSGNTGNVNLQLNNQNDNVHPINAHNGNGQPSVNPAGYIQPFTNNQNGNVQPVNINHNNHAQPGVNQPGNIPANNNTNFVQPVNNNFNTNTQPGNIPSTNNNYNANTQPTQYQIYFENYLSQVSGRAAASRLGCCVAKANGKFHEDDKINVATWKQQVVHIEDPTAKRGYEQGIDSCAQSNHQCNMHDFKFCVVSKCYDAVKSHHGS